MKTLIILLIIITMLGGSVGLTFFEQNMEPILSNSKIDTLVEPEIRKAWAEKVESIPPVFIQIKLYNSNDQFIGYNEGIPQIFYFDKAIEWLEPRSQKSIVTIEGKSFEILQFSEKKVWPEDESHGAYFLYLPINGNLQNIVYFHQDSFHVTKSDYAQIFWTAFKPLG